MIFSMLLCCAIKESFEWSQTWITSYILPACLAVSYTGIYINIDHRTHCQYLPLLLRHNLCIIEKAAPYLILCDGNGILIIAMLLKLSMWMPCDIVPRSRQRGNYTSIVCHKVTCWTIHVCHYTFCCQIHFMFHSLDATSICVLDELYMYNFIDCGWGTQFLG